jgi:hypothetical protein
MGAHHQALDGSAETASVQHPCLQPTVSLLGMPAELRAMIYDDILADTRNVELDKNGQPAGHPLTQVCRQIYIEFQPVYDSRALKNAHTIRARVHNFNFEAVHHVLDLPALVDHARPRQIILRIIIDEEGLHQGEKVLSWLKHCVANEADDKVRSERTYDVTYEGLGSVSSAASDAILFQGPEGGSWQLWCALRGQSRRRTQV